MRLIPLLTVLVFSNQILFAQENLYNLISNTELTNYSAKHERIEGGGDTIFLNTPFIDDFSYDAPYPDNLKWDDDDVYVNNHFTNDQITKGVATFDGLASNGLPYDSDGNSISKPADTLTSKPFFLGGMTSNDSIYLSFLYEAKGLGDQPETDDSLVLEYLDSGNNWNWIWSSAGESTADFLQIVLPVTDPQFLFDGFRFRFRNYASINGNNDHWHLDYIRMAKNRVAGVNDTVISDVAFKNIPDNFLKNYYSMPWNQFVNDIATEIDTPYSVVVRNNHNDTASFTISASITELRTANTFYSSNQLTNNPPPFTEVDIPIPDSLFSGSWNIIFPTIVNNDSAIIRCQYEIEQATPDNYAGNNESYLDHKFFNYFAYDDGSAEKAYGLEGPGLKKFAYKFHLNQADTLRAVRFHFAQIDHDASDQLFSLYVWANIDENNTGEIESSFYHADFSKPFYVDSMNGWTTYKIDEDSLVILPAGDFFVGWTQTDEENMQVGFDVNTDAHTNGYYFSSGGWNESTLNGALMINPVVGADFEFIGTGVDEISYNANLTVFPNPVSQLLNLDFDKNKFNTLEIYNLLGERMLKIFSENQIDVSSFHAGIYFLRLIDLNGNILGARFIKD